MVSIFSSVSLLLLVTLTHCLLASINSVALSALDFSAHDTGGDRRAKKEVVRQLDDSVDKVVVDEVLADLLLRAAAVHDAGETDNGGSAVSGQPAQRVHDERQIRLGLWRQHAGRRKTGVIDERGVAVTLPFNGIGRIGDDGLEGFIIINQIDALLGKIAVFLSQSNYLTPQTPD